MKVFGFKKVVLIVMSLLVIVALISGCAAQPTVAPSPTAVPATAAPTAAPATATVAPTAVPATATVAASPTTVPTIAPTAGPKTAKYVFLFIGDGMAASQRNAAELYLASSKPAGTRAETVKLLMNTFPAQGMTTTYDLSSIITDSASAGTALSTGNKTLSGTINMDPTFKVKYPSIFEVAKAKGYKVGVVSSVSIDHATPASFYAHQPSRGNYYEIGVELVNSNFDYFAGGGFLQPTGKNKDQQNLVDQAKAKGYTYVNSNADFNKLAAGAGKVLAVNSVLQDSSALSYDMDRAADDISLADYTRKGIELLNNPTGFFMMVESGKVDWACHANDAAASIKDTLAFDAAVAEAYKFYQAHPTETLIIVTGDHETGGLSIGFAGTGYSNYINKIAEQKSSYVAFGNKLADLKKNKPGARFEDVVTLIKENFGLEVITKEERTTLNDAVKKGKATDASDADKAAGKAASARLSSAFTDVELKVVQDAFAASMLSAEDRAKIAGADLLYGGYEPLAIKLTTILNQKAGLAWTSYSHTGVPVQTSAVGVGAEQFNGYYDNTDIYRKMMAISGLK